MSSSPRRRPPARRSATTRPCSSAVLADPGSARALPLSDEGARAGSACRAPRADAARQSADRHRASVSSPTTATRRRMRDGRSASRAHVVLTNPDMLHSGILPHHPRWAKLFENLRFVVIDELHAYRGVFGSHLAQRAAPAAAASAATTDPIRCSSARRPRSRTRASWPSGSSSSRSSSSSESGAPRGEKFFLFVNPPVVNRELGIRARTCRETRRVAAEFLKRQLQLIVFCAEPAVDGNPDDLPEGRLRRRARRAPMQIRGYRGGYLPARRREIERGLREGTVRAVVSTNALELGIDIGALDVVVMAGYPGTIAATWQRAGRAGRRQARSAAVLVASSAPIDQFVVRNPSYFFDASPEHALVNPDNLHILLDHVKCAAFELPFRADERFGREHVQEMLGAARRGGLRAPVDAGWPRAMELDATSRIRPTPSASGRSRPTTSWWWTRRTARDVIGETDFTSGPGHAPREGHLPGRRPAVPGGATRLRRPKGVRASGRVRLLHRRHHLLERDDSRGLRQRQRHRLAR